MKDKIVYRTEDQVRDSAKTILGFDKNEKNIKQGTGQITTFNQLGFKGITDKPDGWYLPDDLNSPAIILEIKSEKEDISLQKWVEELSKNVEIVRSKYKNVCGILYNGIDVRVFKNNIELEKEKTSDVLQNKTYYLSLFTQNKIDKQRIYNITKRINDRLHFDFGIKNLYHRMIFTACALVAKRYNAVLVQGMDFMTMKNSILNTLKNSLEENRKLNLKLDLLIEVYDEIKMNTTTNQNAINSFIESVSEISECVNSDYWNGEDVMGIFFNEFNRYKKKTDNGQVFTPDHITSFMYRLIGVNKNDFVLDAACGSGAFLVKAMCNMIKESGGINTKKASEIKHGQLFGIEFDREIYALACANMLIHKDGKTNLEHLDSRSNEACEWIKSKRITKVLMNPPFETKYGCLTIVDNVLKNVPLNTACAFILPDKKLEKDRMGRKLLKHSTLEKIIKLPEKTFSEGVTASVFIFTAGVPQNDKEIFACYIDDDGLETVKNQGRQDIKDRWQDIEDRWINIIRKQFGNETIQWIKPSEHLSYQLLEKPFEIHEEDFKKTVMDYLMFKQDIDTREFDNVLIKKILYNSKISVDNTSINIVLKKENLSDEKVDTRNWKEFIIKDLFTVKRPAERSQAHYYDGDVPFVTSGNFNNGILKYLEPKPGEVLDKGNCITVSPIDGSSFYQEKDFMGRGGAGSSVLLLYNPNLNLRNGYFIAAVIGTACKKYAYNNMLSKSTLEKEKIKLPSDENGNPDFNYMESFILQMRERVEFDLDIFLKIIQD